MELRQLEYFVAVAEEANFTRAAERVHISQSGVSAQIRQLERELGATLIDRSTRTATLTPAGAAALGHARAALAAAAELRGAVDEVTGLVRGRLVVGMVNGCTITPLFDALAAFRRRYPGVELTLQEDGSDRLVDAVRAGTVDVALVGAAGAPPADLESLTVIDEWLVAAVPSGHRLAGARRVALSELAHEPVICMPPGTGVRTAFDRACAAAGVRPEIALEASAPDAAADLSLRGLGVAILSESMAARHPGLRAVAIDGAAVPALLAFVWRAVDNPAMRELVSCCRAAFGLASASSSPALAPS